MNQFLKRKTKESEEELVPIAEGAVPPVVEEPAYNQIALDIYTLDGGRTYCVAEISYNPTTKQAEVKELFSISRLIALQHANTKVALGTLKKKALKV
jgi:hypothetical protein